MVLQLRSKDAKEALLSESTVAGGTDSTLKFRDYILS